MNLATNSKFVSLKKMWTLLCFSAHSILIWLSRNLLQIRAVWPWKTPFFLTENNLSYLPVRKPCARGASHQLEHPGNCGFSPALEEHFNSATTFQSGRSLSLFSYFLVNQISRAFSSPPPAPSLLCSGLIWSSFLCVCSCSSGLSRVLA